MGRRHDLRDRLEGEAVADWQEQWSLLRRRAAFLVIEGLWFSIGERRIFGR
jgi:hypothetical protein